MKPAFRRIAVVGAGLLGGSIGLAAKSRRIVEEVIGVGRSRASLDEAHRHGAIDRGETDLATGIAGAELIVLCTPVRHILEVLGDVASAASPGAIITDVGSTKATIVARGDEVCAGREVFFVGSHPMAGSEKSGVRYASDKLYANSTCFVTPSAATSAEAFAEVCGFWSGLGARLSIARPERHDQLVAQVSHVPHLAAAALVRMVEATQEDKNLVRGIIGNGFRDTTRIACGNTSMWEDICIENSDSIRRAYEAFAAAIGELVDSQNKHDGSLKVMLDQACEYREFLDQR